MKIKTVFALAVAGGQLAGTVFAQELAPNGASQTYQGVLDAGNAVRLGSDIGDAVVNRDIGAAVGSVVAEAAPALLTKGGLPQTIFGLIAGNAIKDLTSRAVNAALNQPDTRSCFEKKMAQAELSYEDVVLPHVSERGEIGLLEYEIELRKEISKRLTDKAKKNYDSYISGCIEDQLSDLKERLNQSLEGKDEEFGSNKYCVATEEQLFEYFAGAGGGDIAYANQAVIQIANDHTTDIIGRNPFVYRIADLELCGKISQLRSNASTNLNSTNDSLYDAIKAEITSEVLENCSAGTALTGEDKAFSLNSNGDLVVRFGFFQCDWEFDINYFCGARACEVREYRVEGSDTTLLETYLE